jgi:hypothetical protein
MTISTPRRFIRIDLPIASGLRGRAGYRNRLAASVQPELDVQPFLGRRDRLASALLQRLKVCQS